jgi:anti-sigma regulatory factor (Ser/Thr protein kinase)
LTKQLHCGPHGAVANRQTRRAKHTETLEQLLDSTLDSVDSAEALVRQTASEVGFNEDDLHDLGMAVREAMVNAVVRQSGRGLLLMEAFVDEFQMKRVPPLGTQVKMVKYLKNNQ